MAEIANDLNHNDMVEAKDHVVGNCEEPSKDFSSSVSGGNDVVHLADAYSLGEMEILDHEKEFEKDLLYVAVEIVKDEDFDDADETGLEDDTPLVICPGTIQGVQLKRLKLRWFLVIIGQWFPKSWLKQFKFGLIAFQLFCLVLLFAYFLFMFGFIGHVHTVVVDNTNYPFTTAKNFVWEFRWILTYLLGIIYHHTGHFEVFLSSLRLPVETLAKADCHKKLYFLFLVVLIVTIPTGLHLLQLLVMHDRVSEYHGKLLSNWQIGLCSTCFALYRIVCLPSFCVVTVVLYLVKAQLHTLGRELRCLNVNLGLSYAKHEIRMLKRKIRGTDSALKWYLICHLILILFSAFTGIFSCIERLRFSVAGHLQNTTETVVKKTIVQPARISPATQRNAFVPVLMKFAEMKAKLDRMESSLLLLQNTASSPAKSNDLVSVKEKSNASSSTSAFQLYKTRLDSYREDLLALSAEGLSQMSDMKTIAMVTNLTDTVITGNNGLRKVAVGIIIKFSALRVILEEASSLLEILVLYLVPLFLLAWHERAIQSITDEIIDIDVEEQRRNSFLFDTEQKKDEIVKYLKTMRGVTVFGTRFSFYKAAFVSVLAPFITITLHFLFKHFHLW